MGYSARRGFTNGKVSGAQRQAEMQQKIQQMQAAMTAAQDEVEAQEFTASVGGGVVEAVVTGKQQAANPHTSRVTASTVAPMPARMLSDPIYSSSPSGTSQSTQIVAAVMPSLVFEIVGCGPSRLKTPWKWPLYRYSPFRLL